MRQSNPKSIFLEAVTSNELSILIDNLKLSKSPGPDNIGPKIIYDSKSVLLEPLLYIYNLSLKTGMVPSQMKIAKVIPIYKKGEKYNPCNYRPISMLSVFEKLLEKIMYKRLISFLNKNNILNEHQFGFRSGHSTTLSLIQIMDEIYMNMDINNIAVGIFFVPTKSF